MALKTTGSSRRDRLASFEAARKKEQRNRTIRLLVICVLLAVLLLAWFLAEPRFQKSGSVQRIAVVLDSSASMGESPP